MNTPLVSINIPVYKCENYITRCLESVKAQTYQNIEIIVVNDGSFENINMFLESYREKIFYFENDNKVFLSLIFCCAT